MKTSTSIMLPGNLTRVFMLLAGLFTLPFQTSARFYPAPLATPITLPIEVIGPDGYTEKVSFDLENAAGINQLYLKIHRPVYRDVSVNSGRGAKASIRLNGGAWIDLTNSTAEAFPHEKQYGGLNGTYHTVRMNVPISGAKGGTNTLEFRFNKTDGLTSGYRVLEFNLLKGNQRVLPSDLFTQDNPANWAPPLNNTSDIQAGKKLWETASLRESSLDTKTLKATCASCHAQDGRDLKYFNYSNWSIQERSKFHGLGEEEAKQIASYIRSLDAPAPAQARPWNPPYQPGPGLDSRPAASWAAGAGVNAVLEDDREASNLAFTGTSVADLRKTIDIDKTFNVREMPTPIQFPDWNDWLPEIHPLDLVGEPFNTVRITNIDGQEVSYSGAYKALRNYIATHDINTIIANRTLYTYMERFATHTTQLHGETYFVVNSAIAQGKDQEVLNNTIVSWGMVKQWELMHTFNLEDKAPAIHGAPGEPLSWWTLRRNVFDKAPHRTAKNIVNLPHQSVLVGKYFSNAWYQLQLALNAGNKSGYNLGPVDWNYQPDHIINLKSEGGPSQPVRYVLSHLKMLQQYNDGKKVGNSMIGFRQIHPARYLKSGIFSALSPSENANMKEALLQATMDLIRTHANSEWPRNNSSFNDNTLRTNTYKPKIFPVEEMGSRLHEHYYEDAWMTMIPEFRNQGVREATLNRLIDWGAEMWPQGDWEALRQSEVSLPAAPTSLTATAISGSQIDIQWADQSDNEVEFRIERKTGSGSFVKIATVAANKTKFSDASLSASTTYSYRVQAYNQAGGSAFSNTASATTPDQKEEPSLQSITVIAASSDDAEQSADNSISLNSDDLDFRAGNLSGVRFALDVPPGAEISKATIDFIAKGSGENTNTLTFQIQAADKAASFTTASANISNRNVNSASVKWTPGAWSDGQVYTSPDLSALIQTIVDREGFQQGNQVVLTIASSAGNSNKRAARTYDYDGTGSQAPTLKVRYDLPSDNSCTGIAEVVDNTDKRFVYSGSWGAQTFGGRVEGTIHETNQAGASWEISFCGSIALIGELQSWGGTAKVYLDGNFVQDISFKGSSALQQTVYQNTLSGSHTLSVEVTGDGWVYNDAILLNGATLRQNYSAKTSIEDEGMDISLYPNPSTNGQLTAEVTTAGILTVHSLEGRQLLQAAVEAGKSTVDISSLSNGMYLVKVQAFEGGTSLTKLLVE